MDIAHQRSDGRSSQSLRRRAIDDPLSALIKATCTLSRSPNREGRFVPRRRRLESEESAALREQLLGDLAIFRSDDQAAEWVHKNLPAKNTLTAADADLVEAGFRKKLAAIELASAGH